MSAVSVIVKSYQRPWLLGICLESIRKHLKGARVIVADDGTEFELWCEARKRYGHLWNVDVHSYDGEEKWALCKDGRFGEVKPTCGKTWNDAHLWASHDSIIFLIEDDSYLIRDIDAETCIEALNGRPDLLCVIGLKERRAMEVPTDTVLRVQNETFLLNHHPVWPWSFDGIFYRLRDWYQIGPWPENVATGPMEGFVQERLRYLGWLGRSFGIANVPFCQFDAQSSVRTDHPSTYAGRFRHVDAINKAWMSGKFQPTFDDVTLGCAPWIAPGACFEPMTLHYPEGLWQAEFCEGWELNALAPDKEAYHANIIKLLKEKYSGGEMAKVKKQPVKKDPVVKTSAVAVPPANQVEAEGTISCADANTGTENVRLYAGKEVRLTGVTENHTTLRIALEECGFKLISLENGTALLRR